PRPDRPPAAPRPAPSGRGDQGIFGGAVTRHHAVDVSLLDAVESSGRNQETSWHATPLSFLSMRSSTRLWWSSPRVRSEPSPTLLASSSTLAYSTFRNADRESARPWRTLGRCAAISGHESGRSPRIRSPRFGWYESNKETRSCALRGSGDDRR